MTRTDIDPPESRDSPDFTATPTFSQNTTMPGSMVAGWYRLCCSTCLAIAVAVPFIFSGFTVFQFTLAGIYAIAILGLNLLTGFTGQFSLGHSTFYAVGGYTAAILMSRFELWIYWTIPLAAAMSLGSGFLFGITVTRLAGIYLALATFALSIATPQILKSSYLEAFTGGVQGLDVIRPEVPAFIPLNMDQWWYFVMLVMLLFLLWTTRNLVNSRSGRAMIAIRDNPIAARSMGINTSLYKAITFGISSLYAGIAGALSAIVIEFVAPDSFTFYISFMFLTGMVIGGMASIPGVIFGALFVLFIPNIAEIFSRNLAYAVFGLLLILTVYVMPTGFAGLVRMIVAYMRNKSDVKIPISFVIKKR